MVGSYLPSMKGLGSVLAKNQEYVDTVN